MQTRGCTNNGTGPEHCGHHVLLKNCRVATVLRCVLGLTCTAPTPIPTTTHEWFRMPNLRYKAAWCSLDKVGTWPKVSALRSGRFTTPQSSLLHVKRPRPPLTHNRGTSALSMYTRVSIAANTMVELRLGSGAGVARQDEYCSLLEACRLPGPNCRASPPSFQLVGHVRRSDHNTHGADRNHLTQETEALTGPARHLDGTTSIFAGKERR